MRSDDLAPQIAQPTPAGVGFRQGIVREWNRTTGENAIEVAGTLLTNLPILNTTEARLLYAGAVVGLLTAGPVWWILGRITIPGSADAGQTLGAGFVAASVDTAVDPASTTYALNGGPSVQTTILPSGQAEISVSAVIALDVSEGANLLAVGDGPNGEQATACFCWASNGLTVSAGTLGGALVNSAAASQSVTGLTPGLWTWELWCRNDPLAASGPPNIAYRTISVLPL